MHRSRRALRARSPAPLGTGHRSRQWKLGTQRSRLSYFLALVPPTRPGNGRQKFDPLELAPRSRFIRTRIQEGCLGEEAGNLKKLTEEGMWEQTKIVWGICYDLAEVATRGAARGRLPLP